LALVELLGLDRLGHRAGIEAGPFVGHLEPDRVRPELGAHVHPLLAVLAVAAHDRVAQRLGQPHLEAERVFRVVSCPARQCG